MNVKAAISVARESTVAVFRYRETRAEKVKNGKVHPAKFNVSWGTGFCVVADKYIVTAFHVLNEGKPRDPKDRYLIFIVPGNGEAAHHFPVIGFPVERVDTDMAVLEIGPCATSGMQLPAVPVTFDIQPDGEHVTTVGFPAPEVAGLAIDASGKYLGGNLFLKSHANEGIVSAQYSLGSIPVYEFNVGWLHGESGGPVLRVDAPIAAFSLMQQYRAIQSPHGKLPGPRTGKSVALDGLILDRLVGGEVQERWEQWDQSIMLQQLGFA